jgi:hypothetical protein
MKAKYNPNILRNQNGCVLWLKGEKRIGGEESEYASCSISSSFLPSPYPRATSAEILRIIGNNFKNNSSF